MFIFSFLIGDKCDFWLWSLCDLWCDKFLDFDRRVKFWFVLESRSIDFTGVCEILRLNFWWFVRGCFVVKYGIFGWVRESIWFIRVWECFWWDSGDFWCGENGWKWRKMVVLSNSLPNSKMGFRRGNNRYAFSGNRTFVLKCKLCPLGTEKHTIIVQYYGMFYFSTLKR